MEDYARLLGEWLDRHKEYPNRAQKRNQQGVVLCEFTMAVDGSILSHRIVESSGFPLLDEEVEALFERASPLPVPPAGADLTYTVPIVFALN
jgi:protein TonB